MTKAKNSQTKQLKLSLYKKYRNIIVDLLRKSKESHIGNILKIMKGIAKQWNGINEIICSKSKANA